jgi:hypothetical protein
MIAKAVEKKFELSDLFNSIKVREKIKEQIESVLSGQSTEKYHPHLFHWMVLVENQQVKDAPIMVISGCTIVSMPLTSICISALLDKIHCFVPRTSQRT